MYKQIRYEQDLDYDLFYTGRRKYGQIKNIFCEGAGFSLYPGEYSFQLEILDEDTRREYKTKARLSITSPQSMPIYEALVGKDSTEAEVANVLEDIETGGLQALALLGETDVLLRLLPCLLKQVEVEHEDEINLIYWEERAFIFRLLLGQSLLVRYAISREERLKRNLPAIKRVPFETCLRLGDLADWEIMIRNAKKKTEAITTYAQNSGKTHLKLADEIWPLWKALERWVPYLEFEPLWSFSILERKVTLREWLVELDAIIQLSEPIDRELPTSLQETEIWSDVLPTHPRDGLVEIKLDDDHVKRVPYYSRREALWPYWSYLFSRCSVLWQLSSKAKVEETKWQADAHTVKMLTRYRLPLQATAELDVEGNEGPLWEIVFQPGQPTHVPAVSNALLLNLQLLMQRGGNWLRPIASGDGWVTIELQMPRADGDMPPPSSEPLPAGVIEWVAHHILVSILPAYAGISQQLESLLQTEIERIGLRVHPPLVVPKEVEQDIRSTPVFENHEQELLYELQQALGELVWLRETLSGHLEVLRQTARGA